MKRKTRKPWLYPVNYDFIKEINIRDNSTISKNINIKVSLYMPMHPFEVEDFLPNYQITAFYIKTDENDDDEPERFPVAWAEAVILDEIFCNGYGLAEACDSISEELKDVHTAIYGMDGYLLKPLEEYSLSPVSYLSEFIVEEKFKIIQVDFLKWIIEFLSNFSPIVVTWPIPSYYTVENNITILKRDFDYDKIMSFRRLFTVQRFLPLRDTDLMYHLYP